MKDFDYLKAAQWFYKVSTGEVRVTISQKRSGICRAFYYAMGQVEWLEDVIDREAAYATWPPYSGELYYPVPCNEAHELDGYKTFLESCTYECKTSPAKWYYQTTDNLWEGEQLELRQSLAKHLGDYCIATVVMHFFASCVED